MRVLLVGGTGWMGRRLARRFLARGDEVAVLARGRSAPAPEGTALLRADRRDAAALRAALPGRAFDAAIDLIAYTGQDATLLLDALQGAVGRYVLCSSGAIYDDRPGLDAFRPYGEDEVDLDAPAPHAYAAGKRAAERAAREAAARGRCEVVVLRPTVIEGPEDGSGRTWFWLQRVLDGQEILVPLAVPSAVFRHVYVEDVVEASFRAATVPGAAGRTYNVAGEEILALDDYVRGLAWAAGGPARIVPVPWDRLRRMPGLEGYRPPFARERFIQDIGRIQAELGWRSTPLSEWLPRTVRWFAEEYSGPDSAGYGRRALEVAAARALQEGGR